MFGLVYSVQWIAQIVIIFNPTPLSLPTLQPLPIRTFVLTCCLLAFNYSNKYIFTRVVYNIILLMWIIIS